MRKDTKWICLSHCIHPKDYTTSGIFWDVKFHRFVFGRSGVTPSSAFISYSWQAWVTNRPYGMARDRTQVDLLRGKHRTCCAIAPAPVWISDPCIQVGHCQKATFLIKVPVPPLGPSNPAPDRDTASKHIIQKFLINNFIIKTFENVIL